VSRALTWTRSTFSILLTVPGEFTPKPFPVAGIVSGAFGVFRGNKKGPDRGDVSPQYSLVLVNSGLFLVTYARRIDCQVLAEELAPLEIAWDAKDPKEVNGPGREAARWLLQASGRGCEL
jgi:hypothetical protein